MVFQCKPLASAAAASIVLAFGAVIPPQVAHADPAAVASARAKAQDASAAVAAARAELQRLDTEESAIAEEWLQAKLRVQQSQQKVNGLKADVAAQTKKVDAIAAQVRELARADFQNQGLDQATKIFVSGDPDSFLKAISTASQVDDNINAVIQRYQAEQANLTDLKRAADAELASKAREEARLAQLDKQAKQKVAEQQAVLNQLTAQERAALAEQERRETEEFARQAALAGERTRVSDGRATPASGPAARAGRASTDTVPRLGAMVTQDASGSARGVAAATYAKQQVGDAYVWAAEGPDEFDCSGLTLMAYRAAGIALPHSSRVQSGTGEPVAANDLRPGDLLFWYNPVHHVGIYVGDGMFVHARNPRVGVVIQPLSSYDAPFSGARRVVG